MVTIDLDPRWKVRLVAAIDLPFAPSVAWRSIADFHRFACMDVFHRELLPAPVVPAVGDAFRIIHVFLGVRVVRVGRILRWHDGWGYSFSDLSRRSPQAGFPHVYSLEISETAGPGCRVTLSVRGRWTARFLGRRLTKLWLGWIVLKTRYALENALLADAFAAARMGGSPPIAIDPGARRPADRRGEAVPQR